MKNRWFIFLLLLSLLAVPAFSMTNEQALSRLGDHFAYTEDQVTVWRLPMGLDGREWIFSIGDLSPVAELEARGSGSLGITLQWSSVRGAFFYTVFYEGDGTWVSLARVNGTSFTDKSAPTEGTRTYRVAAHRESSHRLQSSVLSQEVQGVRMEAMEDLSVTMAAGDVIIGWEPVTGAEGYVVYRDEQELERTEKDKITLQEEDENEHNYAVAPYYSYEEQKVEGKSAQVVVTPQTKEAVLITRVVNKKHPIEPIDYYPEDLVSVGTQGEYLRKEAAEAFNLMNEAAKKDGAPLTAQSGFRSYDLQNKLYTRYVGNYGQKEADTFSARPGYSEHQTGLVMDITGGGGGIGSEGGFAATAQFRWLMEHAYKYGWILRYPRGSESVTGYAYESWHWRYIGVTEATRFKESGLATLEEFYSIEGGDYLE